MKIFELFTALYHIIRLTVGSLFSVLVVGVLFLLVDQGRDLLLYLLDRSSEAGVWPESFFLLALTMMALMIWHSARAITDLSVIDKLVYDNRGQDITEFFGYSFLRWHLPRFYGTLTYFLLAFSLYRIGSQSSAGTGYMIPVLVIGGILFHLATTYRRRFFHFLGGSAMRLKFPTQREGDTITLYVDSARGKKKLLSLRAKEDTVEKTKSVFFLGMDLEHFSRFIFLLLYLFVSIVFFLYSWCCPGFYSYVFFAPNVENLVFWWMGSLAAFITVSVYISIRHAVPVFSILLFLAVLFSFYNDNHSVRVVSEEQNTLLKDRPTIKQAFAHWKKEQAPGPSPILVATAGGGIRASYWTALLLSSLESGNPGAHKQVFSISGVSGGSVGAAFYRALLNEKSLETCAKGYVSSDKRDNPFTLCSHNIFSRDFLSSGVSRMFYTDLLQRFLPVGLESFDRGRGQEKGWVQAYKFSMRNDFNDYWFFPPEDTTESRIEDSFLQANGCESDGCRAPFLFLNGTSVSDGARWIASSLEFQTDVASDELEFYGARDYLRDTGRDLPLVSAALNSARFPGVSPAGTVYSYPSDSAGSRSFSGRIIDGGYYENNGAETTSDIARTLFSGVNRYETDRPAAFIAIQITSDPSIDFDFQPVEDINKTDQKPSGLYEIMSPVAGINAARGARARDESLRLRKLADNYKNFVKISGDESCKMVRSAECTAMSNGRNRPYNYFHFRMCSRKGSEEPPLGWILSQESANRIRSYLALNSLTRADTDRNSIFTEENQDDQFKNCVSDNTIQMKCLQSLIACSGPD